MQATAIFEKTDHIYKMDMLVVRYGVMPFQSAGVRGAEAVKIKLTRWLGSSCEPKICNGR